MRSLAKLGILVCALLAAACNADPARQRMGLFSTLPIYWEEKADIAAMLREPAQPHWARDLLEQRYAIKPLDVLTGEARGQKSPLAAVDVLLLAQPRILSPQENVALDDWVRRGGRVLLFVDPLLTSHSDFAFGDKRRPQDVALLSPLLSHWGLHFAFDPEQPAGIRHIRLSDAVIPVEMAGSLARLPRSTCNVLGGGLVAECRIGKGHALVVADVAILDPEAVAGESREAALAALIDRAFVR